MNIDEIADGLPVTVRKSMTTCGTTTDVEEKVVSAPTPKTRAIDGTKLVGDMCTKTFNLENTNAATVALWLGIFETAEDAAQLTGATPPGGILVAQNRADFLQDGVASSPELLFWLRKAIRQGYLASKFRIFASSPAQDALRNTRLRTAVLSETNVLTISNGSIQPSASFDNYVEFAKPFMVGQRSALVVPIPPAMGPGSYEIDLVGSGIPNVAPCEA